MLATLLYTQRARPRILVTGSIQDLTALSRLLPGKLYHNKFTCQPSVYNLEYLMGRSDIIKDEALIAYYNMKDSVDSRIVPVQFNKDYSKFILECAKTYGNTILLCPSILVRYYKSILPNSIYLDAAKINNIDAYITAGDICIISMDNVEEFTTSKLIYSKTTCFIIAPLCDVASKYKLLQQYCRNRVIFYMTLTQEVPFGVFTLIDYNGFKVKADYTQSDLVIYTQAYTKIIQGENISIINIPVGLRKEHRELYNQNKTIDSLNSYTVSNKVIYPKFQYIHELITKLVYSGITKIEILISSEEMRSALMKYLDFNHITMIYNEFELAGDLRAIDLYTNAPNTSIMVSPIRIPEDDTQVTIIVQFYQEDVELLSYMPKGVIALSVLNSIEESIINDIP